MSEPVRMLDRSQQPTPARVAVWIGAQSFKRWTELTDFVDTNYPGVFETKWWFGGQKHGWTFRFKSKSFLNLIPERGRFKALLVFGADEHDKVEAILPEILSHVRDDYAKATTFHDGKWVATVVDSAKVLADVERLLVLKRKPKAAATAQPPQPPVALKPPGRSVRIRPSRLLGR